MLLRLVLLLTNKNSAANTPVYTWISECVSLVECATTPLIIIIHHTIHIISERQCCLGLLCA